MLRETDILIARIKHNTSARGVSEVYYWINNLILHMGTRFGVGVLLLLNFEINVFIIKLNIYFVQIKISSKIYINLFLDSSKCRTLLNSITLIRDTLVRPLPAWNENVLSKFKYCSYQLVYFVAVEINFLALINVTCVNAKFMYVKKSQQIIVAYVMMIINDFASCLYRKQ